MQHTVVRLTLIPPVQYLQFESLKHYHNLYSRIQSQTNKKNIVKLLKTYCSHSESNLPLNASISICERESFLLHGSLGIPLDISLLTL